MWGTAVKGQMPVVVLPIPVCSLIPGLPRYPAARFCPSPAQRCSGRFVLCSAVLMGIMGQSRPLVRVMKVAGGIAFKMDSPTLHPAGSGSHSLQAQPAPQHTVIALLLHVPSALLSSQHCLRSSNKLLDLACLANHEE